MVLELIPHLLRQELAEERLILAGAEDGLTSEAVRALQVSASLDLLLLNLFLLGRFWLCLLKLEIRLVVEIEGCGLDHLIRAGAAALFGLREARILEALGGRAAARLLDRGAHEAAILGGLVSGQELIDAVSHSDGINNSGAF